MHIIVFITVAEKRQADRIARALVEKRLAACVSSTGYVSSLFRWKGAIEKSREILLIVKSSKKQLSGLIRVVRTMHSYDVPEIIAVPVVGGHSGYLKWVDESLRQSL